MNKHLLSLLQEDSNYKLYTQQERDELHSLFSVLGEIGNYYLNRDSEGNVANITQDMGGGVIKTTVFNRDSDLISSVLISYSDESFTRLYTFIRNDDGVITSIELSS